MWQGSELPIIDDVDRAMFCFNQRIANHQTVRPGRFSSGEIVQDCIDRFWQMSKEFRKWLLFAITDFTPEVDKMLVDLPVLIGEDVKMMPYVTKHTKPSRQNIVDRISGLEYGLTRYRTHKANLILLTDMINKSA